MAKRIFTFYLSVLLLFLCFHSASLPAQEAAEGRVFGGYFEEWDVRYSGYTMATLEKSGVAGKLTHLIYAFGNVTPGPSPVCAIADPKAAWQDASILGVDGKPFSGSVHGNFAGIMELKTLHPRLRTLISLGGQAGDVSGFTAAAASLAARSALVASCIDLFVKGHLAPGVEAPGLFDGFNIDWEFPLPADRENFTALLHEFRIQLDALGRSTGRHYILTFDSPSNPQKYANIDLKAAADEVDFLTIDGYDYATPSEKNTNASSALYNSPADPLRDQARAIDDTVRAYLKRRRAWREVHHGDAPLRNWVERCPEEQSWPVSERRGPGSGPFGRWQWPVSYPEQDRPSAGLRRHPDLGVYHRCDPAPSTAPS